MNNFGGFILCLYFIKQKYGIKILMIVYIVMVLEIVNVVFLCFFSDFCVVVWSCEFFC